MWNCVKHEGLQTEDFKQIVKDLAYPVDIAPQRYTVLQSGFQTTFHVEGIFRCSGFAGEKVKKESIPLIYYIEIDYDRKIFSEATIRREPTGKIQTARVPHWHNIFYI